MPESSFTPISVAIAALAGALGIVAFAISTNVQVGVLLFALFALGGAISRVVLPASAAFAVRRRVVDVSILLVLSGTLTFLGLTTPLN
jgi:hypothetical protein